MPKHISIQPGQLYPQPNYSLAVDREGKWTAVQVFLCHRNSITQLMPRPGTPHPEIDFITLDNATAQVVEGVVAGHFEPPTAFVAHFETNRGALALVEFGSSSPNVEHVAATHEQTKGDQGEHRAQGMAAALRAARIRHLQEGVAQGLELLDF